MARRKSTKRALLLSALSLLMCVSMLIGSTFAWFTDSVTSGNNIIKSGNLDVELEYKTVKDGKLTDKWVTVKDATKIFDPEALWEPGRVEVVYLKVSNLGTLALKYQLGVNVISETLGKTEGGADIRLSEHLVFKTVILEDESEVGKYDDRKEAIDATAGTTIGLKDYNGTTTALEVGGEDYVALIVYMPESVGNEANYRGTAIPTINLGINLFATQYTVEEDSFDKLYDEEAWVDGMKVYNAADLVSALANEDKVILVNDITATDVIELTKDVAINLNGKTLSASLDVSDDVKISIENGTIANTDNSVSGIQVNDGEVTLENVEISSARHAVRVEGGEVTINGGTYKATGTSGMTQHALNVSDGATVTINGGTFIGPKGTGADSGAAVNVQANSTVTINGGNFSNGLNNTLASNGTLTVYGGTFDQNPAAYVAAGYTAVANTDGTYTVLPGEGIEMIENGLYKDADGTYLVTSADGLSNLNNSISQNVTAVKLLADIDMTGKAWTMVDMHADSNGKLATFDGNSHTISNLVINGEAMFSRMASTADTVTFSNVTFENVTVNSTSSNTAIIVKQVYDNLVLDNVDVKGAKISGETKVATLVGTVYNEEASTVTLTVKNCDISDVEITGNPDDASEERLAGLVAWVADKYSKEAIVLENNTMTNVAINSNSTASEHHALIYISDKSTSSRYGVYHNEDAGVTLTNCTYMRKVADGCYVDLAGNYYVYNAAGLNTLNTMLATKSTGFNTVKSINLMADIDFAEYTWTTICYHQDQGYKFTTINGNGYTLKNLKTTAGPMFSLTTMPQTIVVKDLTIENAVVSGGYHVGVIIGQAATDVTFENVHIVGADVTGSFNVGGIIGSSGEFSKAVTVKFVDCSVKNSKITSNGTDGDPTGASGFMGRAVTLGTTATTVVFEGDNVVENNTINNTTGLVGGAVYGYTTFNNGWTNTGFSDSFN